MLEVCASAFEFLIESSSCLLCLFAAVLVLCLESCVLSLRALVADYNFSHFSSL